MYSSFENFPKIIRLIKDGKIGVIPTDTIYGIVGSALNPETVEKIYHLRKRSSDKPFIILISNIDELQKFGIRLTQKQKDFLKAHWPNPLSVVLSVVSDKWKYLHRGTNSLAFRMPKNEWLLDLLKKVGPLVAPSANIEGEKVSEGVDQAKKYFGDRASFYCEAARSSYSEQGKIKLKPSTLIKLKEDGKFKVLRKGTYRV